MIVKITRRWIDGSSVGTKLAALSFFLLRSLIAVFDAITVLFIGAVAALAGGSRLSDFSPLLDQAFSSLFGAGDRLLSLVSTFIAVTLVRALLATLTGRQEVLFFGRVAALKIASYIRESRHSGLLGLANLPREEKLFSTVTAFEALHRDYPRVVIGLLGQISSALLVLMLLLISNPEGVLVLFGPLAVAISLNQLWVGRLISKYAERGTKDEIGSKSLILGIVSSMESVRGNPNLKLAGGKVSTGLNQLARIRAQIVLLTSLGPQLYQLVVLVSLVALTLVAQSSDFSIPFALGDIALVVAGLFRVALSLSPVESSLSSLRELSRAAEYIRDGSHSSSLPRISSENMTVTLQIDRPTLQPLNSQHSLFVDIRYTINSPSVVKLVGPSGSGKTTLLSGLSGNSEVVSGVLSFTDNKSNEVMPRTIYIPSEIDLIDGTLKDNLVHFSHLEEPLLDDQAAWEALAEVGLSSEMTVRSLSLDSNLSDSDVRLSLGQRFRLRLAAALIRPPQVLLIDEIYSHLDASSSSLVDSAIEGLQNDCIIVVAGHHFGKLKEDVLLRIP